MFLPFLVLIKELKGDHEDLQGHLIYREEEDIGRINLGEKVFKDRMRLENKRFTWKIPIVDISVKELWLWMFKGKMESIANISKLGHKI